MKKATNLQCREPSCKKVFYSYSGRQGHEDRFHPDSPYRMYRCTFPECEDRPILWSVDAFRAHLRETHHSSKDDVSEIVIAAETQAAERRKNQPALPEKPAKSKPEPVPALTKENDQEDDKIVQILDLRVQGLTWRELSERLGITANTGTIYAQAASWTLNQYLVNRRKMTKIHDVSRIRSASSEEAEFSSWLFNYVARQGMDIQDEDIPYLLMLDAYRAGQQSPQMPMDPVVAVKTLLDDYEQMKLKAEMGNEAYTAVNVLQQERDDLQHELSTLQDRIRNLLSGEVG
jgi:hypothetical protein